jgi:hypothetical protein
MALVFIQPYYQKCLLNGSTEVTAYWQCAYGESSGCWMKSPDATKVYKAVVR